MKVTLLLPTLNEIEALKEILPRIKNEWYDQLIICDGGSTDGTIEYARENGYFVDVQKGKGVRRGYELVFNQIDGDIIITFPPDGNSIPELIPDLIKKMENGFDMVIVSRYLDGARSYDDDAVTRLGNRAFTRLTNLLYRGDYTDTLVGYRAYRKDTINKTGLLYDATFWADKLLYKYTERTSWEYLSVLRCAKRKLKVAEMPGDEPKRIGGQRKMSVIKNGLVCLAELISELINFGGKQKGAGD